MNDECSICRAKVGEAHTCAYLFVGDHRLKRKGYWACICGARFDKGFDLGKHQEELTPAELKEHKVLWEMRGREATA